MSFLFETIIPSHTPNDSISITTKMHPTQALLKRTGLRRLALTTKQGPHNYYKGNRTGSMGRHTKYGGYVLDYKKVRTFVVPDLTDFKVSLGFVLRDGGGFF